MIERKLRVLFVSSQPIQNPVPFRLLAQNPKLEITVAYCSLSDPTLWQDSEYLNKEVFDVPILAGYPWVYVRNISPRPRLGKFFGLVNPGIVPLIPKIDCCIIYGHSYFSFWMGILTAKLFGKPILLSTDAIDFGSAARSVWKMMLKRKFLSFLYSKIADAVLVPSTASKQFVHSLGIPERNIFVTPYVVDNESISAAAQKTDRTKTRAQWKIPKDALVVLFCGKFLPRKRPLDLLRAFSIANMANSYLVLVGDGPLWSDLNSEVQQLGLASRVRFLGLVDYSKLPEVYASSNILIHPAENEPYGLIVNEAMVCGLPVIVSDRVGAGLDLIKNGITGFTYPCGDINALVDILRRSLSDRDGLKDMGRAAQHRMERWSPRENAETTAHAIERVTNLKRK